MARGSLENQIGLESSKRSNNRALEAQRQREQDEFEIIRRFNKKKSDLTIKETKALNKKLDELEKERNKKSQEDFKKLQEENAKYAITTQQKIIAGLKKLTDSTAFKAATSAIDSYIGVYSGYMSGISTRLQGFTRDFNQIQNKLTNTLGLSPYVKQTDVLSNVSKFVQAGIANNLEQRAFLETVADRIATTFSSFDGSLLQIIKIQQADTTAARLGLEASLTKYFNRMFGDTSYLNQAFDAVSNILLESSAQLNGQQSIAYEYAIQKWLGSLSAVGVSESTLQSLASGLNLLGTGNISGLASNESLQRLLVTASGSSYADILTGGLGAQNANMILSNVVTLAQQLSSIENNVVRQEYAKLYGFSLADLRAIANLKPDDIKSISESMLDYGSAMKETARSLSTIGKRTSIKDMIDNVVGNLQATMGEQIASNPGLYVTWSIADLLQKTVGGINIPITFTSGINLAETMKVGLVGYSLLGSLGSVISSLRSGGGLDLASWGADDYLTRGTGTTSLRTTGVTGGLSQMTFVGSTTTSDIYKQTAAGIAEEQKQYSAATGEETDLTKIVRDRIAVTLDNMYTLLQNTLTISGVKIRNF